MSSIITASRRLGGIWLVLGALLFAPSLWAKDVSGVDDHEFKSVAGQLRCPTCTGLSVLDSEAAFSVQIKNQVREQIAEGKDEKAILAYFTERYGPWILREPPAEGVNLIAWIVPIALLVLGPVLVWFFVWRRQTVVQGGHVRTTEAILEEMQAQLARMKKESV